MARIFRRKKFKIGTLVKAYDNNKSLYKILRLKRKFPSPIYEVLDISTKKIGRIWGDACVKTKVIYISNEHLKNIRRRCNLHVPMIFDEYKRRFK